MKLNANMNSAISNINKQPNLKNSPASILNKNICGQGTAKIENNRSESAQFKNLQLLIDKSTRNNNSRVALIQKSNIGRANKHAQIIQRRAQVVKKEVTIKEPGKGDLDSKEIVLDPKQEILIKDAYIRNYKDEKEFKDHAVGSPVDVGLAKRIGKWYTAPFSKGFFVLGENHKELSYKTVVQESNQKGKVLGEKDAMAFMSRKAPGDALVENTEPADPVEGVKEFPMESMASKLYFAISRLNKYFDSLHKETDDGVIEEDEDQWIVNYKKAGTLKQNTQGRVPVYLNDEGKWVKARLGTSEEKYNFLDVVKFYIQSFLPKMVSAKETPGMPKEQIEIAETNIKLILVLIEQKEDKKTAQPFLDKAVAAIEQIAIAEINEAKLNEVTEMGAKTPLKKREEAVKQQSNKMDSAMAMRDLAMLASIRQAKKENFLMAGLGNNHAINLEDDLKPDITVIKKDDLPMEDALIG